MSVDRVDIADRVESDLFVELLFFGEEWRDLIVQTIDENVAFVVD
jgi:hypothetical protein